MSDLNEPHLLEFGFQPRPQLGLLRRIAVIGTGAIFLWRVTSLFHMEPRQDWGLVVLVLAAIAVWVTAKMIMPAAIARLRLHLDLLLPLGLYLTAQGLLELLLTIPILSAVLSPSTAFTILSLSFTLSAAFLLQIVLAVIYAAWTTSLVLQAVRQDRVDPLRSLAGRRNWFWRVLGAEAIGWAVIFAVLAVAITVGAAILPLALIAIVVFSLVWNLMTAALLPVVVGESQSFGESLREGIRVSWAGKRRWWPAVVAQMVLLGWTTLFSVSYTDNSRPGSFSRQEKTDFSVNAFWTGGFEDECRWHSKLMAAVKTKPLPLAEFLLGGLFAVLAILVKLEVVDRMYPPTPVLEGNSSLEDEWPPEPM